MHHKTQTKWCALFLCISQEEKWVFLQKNRIFGVFVC
jgi:hypothetical protein